MRLRLAVTGIALAVAGLGCAPAPRWVVEASPTRAEVEMLLETGRARELRPDTVTVQEIPDVPVRVHLRPCCVLGSDVRASIAGLIPIPLYRIPNILGPGDLGAHVYDSGALTKTTGTGPTRGADRERNGLVYTCRGGFIDTAHVRDYSDWAIFLAAQIGRRVVDGGEIRLPDEGGSRRVVVRPLPPEVLQHHGLTASVITLAQWTAFQLSIWHEIATWYGWESVPGFSERVSAFSPEDLYSNMLGTRLMLAIVQKREARSETEYNRAVDAWLARSLELLGAVPRDLGSEVARAVDGLWWDSAYRVPDPRLVQRRNFAIGDPIRPWLVPDSALSSDLRARLEESCGTERSPVIFPNPGKVRGVTLGDHVTLEIEVDAALAEQEPFASLGPRIDEGDFPEIVAAARQQAIAEFGPHAADGPG